MADLQLTNWLNAAKESARRAAEALEHWRGKFRVREKGRADPVSGGDPPAPGGIPAHLPPPPAPPRTLFWGGGGGTNSGPPPPPTARRPGSSTRSTALPTTSTTARCTASRSGCSSTADRSSVS